MGSFETKLALAQALAGYAHEGQTDRAGVPYIHHPMTVSARVTGEAEKITALLHDVVEDTPIQLSTIRNLFGDTIADAVDCLTRREGESYLAYAARAAQNPIARQVKLADLDHNMDLSRLNTVTEKDLQRLERYRQAKALLEAFPEEPSEK